MDYQELVVELAKKTNYTPREVRSVLREMALMIREAIQAGGEAPHHEGEYDHTTDTQGEVRALQVVEACRPGVGPSVSDRGPGEEVRTSNKGE
jgi:hypothetical protein